jgi:hypothetical protein
MPLTGFHTTSLYNDKSPIILSPKETVPHMPVFSPPHFRQILILIPLLCTTLNAFRQSFDYRFVEEELQKPLCRNRVGFTQISDTPIVYRAWGTWNFPHPVSEIAEVALDFSRYPKTFNYVYRCDRIIEPENRIAPSGTWYVEGRASFARVWAIGDIDTILWTDSAHLRLFSRQNEDRRLEKKWSYREPGWLNFRTHGVNLAAFIVAAGPDSSRVGIVVQGWVRKSMPQWLIRLSISMILPQFLRDLDNAVQRRSAARAQKNMPWYNKLRLWFGAEP